MSERNAAIKRVATDGSLGTGGSADGGAVGDAGVGEEAEGGEAKAYGWGDCGVAGGSGG